MSHIPTADKPAGSAQGVPAYPQQLPHYPPPPPGNMPYAAPSGPAPTYAGPPAGAPAHWVPPQPVPGIRVGPPKVAPVPGYQLLEYRVEQPEAGCCKCDSLSQEGLITMVVLLLVFAPLAFIPCVMQSCHRPVQRPVFGPAPAAPGYAPTPAQQGR